MAKAQDGYAFFRIGILERPVNLGVPILVDEIEESFVWCDQEIQFCRYHTEH